LPAARPGRRRNSRLARGGQVQDCRERDLEPRPAAGDRRPIQEGTRLALAPMPTGENHLSTRNSGWRLKLKRHQRAVVLLDPKLVQAFPDSKSVNDAL